MKWTTFGCFTPALMAGLARLCLFFAADSQVLMGKRFLLAAPVFFLNDEGTRRSPFAPAAWIDCRKRGSARTANHHPVLNLFKLFSPFRFLNED